MQVDPTYAPPPDGRDPAEPADPGDWQAIMLDRKAVRDAGTVAGLSARESLRVALAASMAAESLPGRTAMVLAAALDAVLDQHRPLRIYDECDHDHDDDDLDAGRCIDVSEVGYTCEDGYLYSVCQACCMDDLDTGQREPCADGHDHRTGDWLCETTERILAAVTVQRLTDFSAG